MRQATARPEIALVLLLLQATLWGLAGLSAIPFAIAGFRSMFVLSLATLALATAAAILGIGLHLRWRRARGWAIALESACLIGSVLQLALPIGASRGLVSTLVNVALPGCIIWLVRGRTMRAAFEPVL